MIRAVQALVATRFGYGSDALPAFPIQAILPFNHYGDFDHVNPLMLDQFTVDISRER